MASSSTGGERSSPAARGRVFVVYVKSHLSRGDADYGLFLTAIGLGSILGSLRVYGFVTAFLVLPAAVSMLAGGWLAKTYGVDKVLIGAGAFSLVSLIFKTFAQAFPVSVCPERGGEEVRGVFQSRRRGRPARSKARLSRKGRAAARA